MSNCPKCGAKPSEIHNAFQCNSHFYWDEWPNPVRKFQQSDRCQINELRAANAALTVTNAALLMELEKSRVEAAEGY